MISNLFEQFVTAPNIGLQLFVMFVLWLVRKHVPELAETPAYARVAPFLPLVLCILGVMFLPSAAWVTMALADRALLGATLGALAGWTWKAYRQTLRGDDARTKGGAS